MCISLDYQPVNEAKKDREHDAKARAMFAEIGQGIGPAFRCEPIFPVGKVNKTGRQKTCKAREQGDQERQANQKGDGEAQIGGTGHEAVGSTTCNEVRSYCWRQRTARNEDEGDSEDQRCEE